MNLVTILGLVAATCTTIAYVPQAIKTIKTKQTKDLSLPMYAIVTFGFLLWLIYGIMIKDIPLIFANVITISLSSIILGFKIKYG